MTIRLAPAIALLALAGAASAQTGGGWQVDQVSSPSAVQVDQLAGARDSRPNNDSSAQQLGPAGPVSPTAQIAAAGSDPRVGQLAAPGQAGGATPQLSRRDTNPRVAAIPPWMVDACEEAAAGRRPPPDSVDCSQVLEAVAAADPGPSAEETLLNATDEGSRQSAVQAGLGRTPNADEIARRLGSGDVQNAPIAQAVGAGFIPPPETGPPAGNTPVVIPGRSGPTTIIVPSGSR